MPTVFSHVAVPLALRAGLGDEAIPRPMLLAGLAASVIPDLDGIAFQLGVAYGSPFGHRGATHSIAFALAMGVAAALFAPRWKSRRALVFLYVAACGASHGLLDTFTNGGRGVALWWPFTTERFFAPWRPIEVSPLTLQGLMTERGVHVLASELAWVWLPAALAASALLALRRASASMAVEPE
jgi:inner membrane protein